MLQTAALIFRFFRWGLGSVTAQSDASRILKYDFCIPYMFFHNMMLVLIMDTGRANGILLPIETEFPSSQPLYPHLFCSPLNFLFNGYLESLSPVVKGLDREAHYSSSSNAGIKNA
jgi:hypothetical protein